MDFPGRERVVQVDNEIPAGALARLDAGDGVIGGIRSAVVTGVLPDGHKKIPRARLLKPIREPLNIKPVHAPIPLLRGDRSPIDPVPCLACQVMTHDTPFGVMKPIGAVGYFDHNSAS